MRYASTMAPDPANIEHRPLGLRFITEIVNEARSADDWARIAGAHGGREFASRAYWADAVAGAVAELRAVFAEDDPQRAARALNGILERAPLTIELAALDDGRWAVRPRIPSESDAAATLLALSAFALGQWLSERQRTAWGVCTAERCDRVFIDEGRRAPQRFCSTGCATRTRVAAHRRQRAGTTNG